MTRYLGTFTDTANYADFIPECTKHEHIGGDLSHTLNDKRHHLGDMSGIPSQYALIKLAHYLVLTAFARVGGACYA
jgi:hypothetical protein